MRKVAFVLIKLVQSGGGYALLDYAVNRLDCQMSLVPNPNSSFCPQNFEGGQVTQDLYSPDQHQTLGRSISPIILNDVYSANSC